MNTPPLRRRFVMPWDRMRFPAETGTAAAQLSNPEYAIRFAMIVSEFEHLEDAMAAMMALLMGSPDKHSAGYILRAIRSPSARREVMTTLLQQAPHNQHLGPEYDDHLAEYTALSRARNDYVHGLWYTDEDDGSVRLARKNEHGLSFLLAAPEPIENLDNILGRIRSLRIKVYLAWSSAQRQKKRRKARTRPTAKPIR